MIKNIKEDDVVVLGIPFDEYSTFMRGPAEAPKRIREVWHAGSANMCTESMTDLEEHPKFIDFGDIEVNDYMENISTAVSQLLDTGAKVLSLGGDHSVTYPILKAYADKYEKINILHLDAHPDLYEEYDGNPHSHACPMARIMENNLAQRLVQIGIRTMNPHQCEQVQRFNVETITMKKWNPVFRPRFDGPVYVTLDLDALDPAYAPGVSHHEPGGLSTRQVLDIIEHIDAPVIGADVVELNPKRDNSGITAMLAFKLMKELAGKMLEQ